MKYKNQAEFEAGDLTIEEITGHQWSSKDSYDKAVANWCCRATTGLNAFAEATKRCAEELGKAFNKKTLAIKHKM